MSLPQESGLDSTESRYDLKEMHRIVNSLPKEYKVPFSMHVSGFKYREIAEKLDLPLGTVKSRIFFTRQRLQEELKDLYSVSTLMQMFDVILSPDSPVKESRQEQRYRQRTILCHYTRFTEKTRKQCTNC